MTVSRHEAVTTSTEQFVGSSGVNINALKQARDERIRDMPLGLDPATMTLDRRGRPWRYKSQQEVLNALSSSSRPARP